MTIKRNIINSKNSLIIKPTAVNDLISSLASPARSSIASSKQISSKSFNKSNQSNTSFSSSNSNNNASRPVSMQISSTSYKSSSNRK